MKYLTYKNRNNKEIAFIENVAIQYIANQVSSPFYAYSKKSLIENYQEFANNFSFCDHKICYAIKANANLNLVRILASLGSGIDAVSAGEIFIAIKAGINPKKIVFAGVGKTKDEIDFAIKNGVEEFSCESEQEMFALNEIASLNNKKIKFSLRINPDVDAKTHQKISTGKKGDKFGVDINLAKDFYNKAKNLPNLEIYGISVHIGSQILSLEPFRKAFIKIRELCLELRENGHNIQSLDFGGGIGINYNGEKLIDIKKYAEMIRKNIEDLGVKLTIAPGRAIVGNAAILATKTIYIKNTESKKFAIIDAAMNDLARPGLYGSYHNVLPETRKIGQKEIYDLAGPICESTDILAKDREFYNLQNDDLLLFLSVGAYGSSMSNEYNARPLIPEILIDDDKFSIIRRRPTFEEMIKLYQGNS